MIKLEFTQSLDQLKWCDGVDGQKVVPGAEYRRSLCAEVNIGIIQLYSRQWRWWKRESHEIVLRHWIRRYNTKTGCYAATAKQGLSNCDNRKPGEGTGRSQGSCAANKEAALVAYNEENKFAMKCNSLLCSRHIVFCPVMTEKDRVTISCIESTSILFRSVGTRNWLYGIRMHLPFFECPIKCPCGTLRSHIIMHCIVFHPLIAIFQHSWITALLLVHATTKHNPRYVPQQGHNRRCRRRSCICVSAIQFAHSLRGRSVEKDSLVCSEEGLECTSHSG